MGFLEEAQDANYKFLTGMYISQTEQTDNALFVYSDLIDDTFWNYAAKINAVGCEEILIGKVIEYYKSKNKTPAFCITPETRPGNLGELLLEKGFKRDWTDAWMFDEKGVDPPQSDLVIKEVRTGNEMDNLVETFKRSYAGAEGEVYGALPPAYPQSLRRSFPNTDKRKSVIHYLGFLEDKPVALATLIHDEKFAGIYNVGTIPENRKQGIGAVITLYARDVARKKGCQAIFLQTESGTYNEKFYSTLGFVTKFKAKSYIPG